MRFVFAVVAAAACVTAAGTVQAADHLDTPAVIEDPRADIGDLFAWVSPDGWRLNLAMTIVGHRFSDKLTYVFHVDSGKQLGKTTATTTIECWLSSMTAIECAVDEIDRAAGDPSQTKGIEGHNQRFTVFAGLRDDPFFNNVKGTREAYNEAAAALPATARDAAGCPQFKAATSQAILKRWRQTSGGPAQNFLAGWTPASLVVAVDLDVVTQGGPVLAVWGATVSAEGQVDRMGRPLTANALLATLGPAERSNDLKAAYNAATPATSAQFVAEIEQGLAFYDGFDGHCGNQWLADRKAPPSERYRVLAELLADDRLWVNSASLICKQFFAVELANRSDCGGRTPNYDAVDIYRSLLMNGKTRSVDDGVDRDDAEHSELFFPFLAK
jgi:hypothetical protein